MAEAKAAALVSTGQLEKAKLAEVKGLLKELGQSQAGEKSELAARLRLFVEGAAVRGAGELQANPAALKIGELRKELAKRGLPCDTSIETRDELLRRLIDTLKRDTRPSAGASASGAEGAAETGEARAVALAEKVLKLAETGEDEAILSLGAEHAITRESTVALMRKAYLTLSRSIHPDKLGRAFADATKAFQALVGAFERLSQPEVAAAGETARGKGQGKAAALARSNANCFRTKVSCPRCKVEWGQGVDGVEKYCYSVLMQGIRCYTCSTCLLDFGCMTALHACPQCAGPFEYAPADYHRQVACGSPKCAKPFGFFLFVIPPRVEADLRAEVKAAAERRLRAVEGARARAERAARKAGAGSAAGTASMDEEGADGAERAFVRGLADECPRCGWAPSATEAKRELLAEHLRACTDARKHAAHRKRKATAEAERGSRAAGRLRQDDAMTEAAWQFLGGSASQMWMLTDEQLRNKCLEAGLEAAGEPPLDRTERLARLGRRDAEADNSRLLADGASGGATRVQGRAGGRAAAPSAGTLPDNLHSLSLRQLRDVCAAHGFTPKGRSTDAVIHELESRRFAGAEAEALLLE